MEKIEPVAFIDAAQNLRMGKKREEGNLYSQATIDQLVRERDGLAKLVDSLTEKLAIDAREIEGWQAVAAADEELTADRDEQIAELEEKIKQQIRFRGEALSERELIYEKHQECQEHLSATEARMQPMRDSIMFWRHQSAESQALCQKYREALELVEEHPHTTNWIIDWCRQALATPSPTAALNNAIADELDRMANEFVSAAGMVAVEPWLRNRATELREEAK